MASETGDLPSPKHSRLDDMPRRGEKGKGVQRQGSSKVKGATSSSTAASSSTGREKGKYVLRKHPARKPSQKENDIYINRTSDFGAQMARCRKLLDSGHKELTIHGLGAAINRAINLALQLKETSSLPMEVKIDTSTVEVLDDLEPLTDVEPHQTQSRLTSAVHIQLYHLPLTEPQTKIVYSQHKGKQQQQQQ